MPSSRRRRLELAQPLLRRASPDPSSTSRSASTSAAPPLLVHGTYDGLTVELQPLSLGQRLVHDVSRDPATIIPEGALHPSGESDATYQAVQKSAYVDGAQVAAAVAERALGLDVTDTVRGVTVDDVLAHSPAAKVLSPGDLITAVDGNPSPRPSDLPDAIRRATAGQ